MKVGFTCGAFDLLHAGHVVMLQEAKNNCDFLIVGLQTDPTLDRSDKNKPVQSIYERYIQLHGIEAVDEVIPYDRESSLMDILTTKPIDIRFVGEEYKDKQFTGQHLDIEIYYTSRSHTFSSTDLRKRVKAAK
jgi:glycerol-3-phosphate cytidylyltransferase|tara:strand:- start:432 stop:830 length:399 start_codon:yes stop_codon:yes gene_type:complete